MDKCQQCQIEIIIDENLTEEQKEKILALCPTCYEAFLKDMNHIKNTQQYLH